jgi:hypothetical protein
MENRFVFLLFIICLSGRAQDTVKTNVVLDSLGNEVFLVRDSFKQPTQYFSPIFTPVCVDGSCYPIHIELHWDLAGNYLKYTLPKNEILTKIEHLPFTDFDYGLLDRMIARTPSALANYSIYDLTLPSESEVDGVTGATRPELSGYFVPDALFTSYTLWHLVRKPKAELLNITKEKYFTSQWTDFIMKNCVLECRKAFVLELLANKSEIEQTSILLEMYRKYTDSFPVDLLRDIADNDSTRQFFVMLYEETDNSSVKLSILKRWTDLGINEYELQVISNEIGNCASCFNDELALIKNFKNWPERQYEVFYLKIQSQRNMMRKSKMIAVLEERKAMYPRKMQKIIKKNNF